MVRVWRGCWHMSGPARCTTRWATCSTGRAWSILPGSLPSWAANSGGLVVPWFWTGPKVRASGRADGHLHAHHGRATRCDVGGQVDLLPGDRVDDACARGEVFTCLPHLGGTSSLPRPGSVAAQVAMRLDRFGAVAPPPPGGGLQAPPRPGGGTSSFGCRH